MYLRPVQKNDFQFLTQKYIEVFACAPWNEENEFPTINEYIKNIYEMNTFIGFILESTESTEFLGAALGYIKPWYQGEEYVLDTFFIEKEHQSLGLGGKFLTMLKKELKEKNIPTIMLDTDKGMPAEFFYKKNGFSSSTSAVMMFCETDHS